MQPFFFVDNFTEWRKLHTNIFNFFLIDVLFWTEKWYNFGVIKIGWWIYERVNDYNFSGGLWKKNAL